MTAISSSTARRTAFAISMLSTVALAGCAADGNPFETGSITPPPQPTASIDPQCATLAQQIEQIKTEGTVGRLEKVADGKGKTAIVKRTALQQQSQLNKANADYIAKCGASSTRAAAAPTAAPVVTAAAQPGASGVTVAAPKATAPAAATPKQ